MYIKIIHVSDIHFGSGESHGTINQTTGLNIRFEDFVKALKKTVDFAISKQADLFLFSGDAYKNPSPEPVYQKHFAQELNRLAKASIPIILLVGNHDQIFKAQNSHSMSVFQSLEISGLIVIDKPELIKIDTKRGPVQIIGIPHLNKHILMTHEKYADFSEFETDDCLVKHLKNILDELYDELDPNIPSILTAHIMLDTARVGSEQELMLGYCQTFPRELFINEKIDYVALGHVHSHQVLRQEKPCIAYAGSIERVDFSEEKEDKGFIEIDLKRSSVKTKFHSTEPRPFITIDLDLSASKNPSKTILDEAQRALKDGAVVRLKYRIQQNRLNEINEKEIRKELNRALSIKFKPEIIHSERPKRIPDLNEETLTNPLITLDKYLSAKNSKNKDSLLTKAKELMKNLETSE